MLKVKVFTKVSTPAGLGKWYDQYKRSEIQVEGLVQEGRKDKLLSLIFSETKI